MVHLEVQDSVGDHVSPTARRRLKMRVERALRAAGVERAELSMVLCDDGSMRALNRRYADCDHATDVLSFSQREGLEAPGVGTENAAAELLGDVVISAETAARQAAAGASSSGERFEAELLHLAVHGLAHLLGYDHDTPAKQRTMWAREAELRAASLRAPARRPRTRAPR